MWLFSPRQEIVRGRDFEWSQQSWTHNVFRFYELVFGRTYGPNGIGDTIRKESSTMWTRDGVYHACHSWESVFALVETLVRGFFRSLKPIPIRISIPVLQTPQGFPIFASPYIFAIALDATSSAANVNAISTTFAHTNTGSNLYMSYALSAATTNTNQTVSTITYNAVGATSIDVQNDNATNNRITELWYQVGPATGANNVVVTYANQPGSFFNVGVASYSGVSQTGQPDAFGKNTSGASNVTSMAKSITTVADNCWIVGAACNLANGTSTAGDSGTTLRQSIYQRVAGGYELFQLDSNGAKTPAGAYSTGYNWTGNAQANIVVASIAPVAGDATTVIGRGLSILGIGQ